MDKPTPRIALRVKSDASGERIHPRTFAQDEATQAFEFARGLVELGMRVTIFAK